MNAKQALELLIHGQKLRTVSCPEITLIAEKGVIKSQNKQAIWHWNHTDFVRYSGATEFKTIPETPVVPDMVQETTKAQPVLTPGEALDLLLEGKELCDGSPQPVKMEHGRIYVFDGEWMQLNPQEALETLTETSTWTIP